VQHQKWNKKLYRNNLLRDYTMYRLVEVNDLSEKQIYDVLNKRFNNEYVFSINEYPEYEHVKVKGNVIYKFFDNERLFWIEEELMNKLGFCVDGFGRLSKMR
jgi:hypothetical protein